MIEKFIKKARLWSAILMTIEAAPVLYIAYYQIQVMLKFWDFIEGD